MFKRVNLCKFNFLTLHYSDAKKVNKANKERKLTLQLNLMKTAQLALALMLILVNIKTVNSTLRKSNLTLPVYYFP
jgi:hypothetical protein